MTRPFGPKALDAIKCTSSRPATASLPNLRNSICNNMPWYYGANRTATLHDLARYVTSLMTLQSETHNQDKTRQETQPTWDSHGKGCRNSNRETNHVASDFSTWSSSSNSRSWPCGPGNAAPRTMSNNAPRFASVRQSSAESSATTMAYTVPYCHICLGRSHRKSACKTVSSER